MSNKTMILLCILLILDIFLISLFIILCLEFLIKNPKVLVLLLVSIILSTIIKKSGLLS
mgnify:CR=1 FL=1